MFFDLANAFAIFQIHINFALKKYLNDFCVCYLNDILIYFQREENHTNHVRLVLKRLKKYKMFVKFSKCVFDLKKIDYLKFIVKINDIRMNFAKIVTIKKWIELTTRRHVRIFIKFAEFYRRFIKKFNKIVESLTNLFKEKKKKEFDKMFKLIKKARKAFNELKKVFIKTSILLHFDLKRRIQLKIDVFDFAISEIIFQFDRRNRSMTSHCILFSKNVRSRAKLWNWRKENARDDRVMSRFSTLRERSFVFDSDIDLNKKKTRWWKKLNDLNLHIEYRSSKLNLADDSSRRFDYESNESIIVNAIAKNDNKLIINRVHVQAFIVEHDSQKNREKNNESSSILSSMKKNRQSSSKSKTANEMNIENDLIRNEKSRSIVSHAYVNLIVRTRILSTEEFVSAIQTKAFQTRFESRSLVIRKQHEKFKKTFRFVVKKTKDFVSKKAIEEIAHKDINFVNFSIEFRIVLKILQQFDQFAQEKTIQTASSITEKTKFERDSKEKKRKMKNDILHFEEKYYILASFLRKELFKQNHDDFHAKHFEYEKILELFRRKYWWSNMSKNVKEYVVSCTKCSLTKSIKHKFYELLQSLSIFMKFKKNWTMNFIIDLSFNKRSEQIYDFILIIIDRYTKYFRYISARKDWTTKQLTNQLFDEIFFKHEMSKSIMFNKNSLFIFNFWFNFCYHLRIKIRLNIVFHFQTDDQTKRQNQTLKQYLRIYVNYQQNNWVKLLFVTEFAYNNN